MSQWKLASSPFFVIREVLLQLPISLQGDINFEQWSPGSSNARLIGYRVWRLFGLA
jgi:hypothetical protein